MNAGQWVGVVWGALSLVTLGFLLGVPTYNRYTGRPLRTYTNVLVSAMLAAVWPITWLLIIGINAGLKEKKR